MKPVIAILILCFSAFACFGQNAKDEIKPSDKYLDRKNIENSVPRLKRAAESGIAEAQYNYAIYFLEIMHDPKTANEWFLKSAEQGFANAQFKIAYSYATGRGIETDNKKSFYWMSKCAEQNDSQAIFTLAGMYFNGTGTEPNVNKAVGLVTKVALLPVTKNSGEFVLSARLNLAEIYMEGKNAEKDLVKSYAWLLIFNEDKTNFEDQDAAIKQTILAEKKLNESDKKEAIGIAENLLGRKLVNLPKLYSNIYQIPVE